MKSQGSKSPLPNSMGMSKPINHPFIPFVILCLSHQTKTSGSHFPSRLDKTSLSSLFSTQMVRTQEVTQAQTFKRYPLSTIPDFLLSFVESQMVHSPGTRTSMTPLLPGCPSPEARAHPGTGTPPRRSPRAHP